MWPDNGIERMLFGDREVAELSHLLNLPPKDIIPEFREYKSNPKRVGKSLKCLIQNIKLYPVSSAECERGFSAMNLQRTSTRNSLQVATVSSLLMVQINGPPLSVWDVKPYVISWLKGRHAATDKPTGKKTTEKTVSYKSKLFGITNSV